MKTYDKMMTKTKQEFLVYLVELNYYFIYLFSSYNLLFRQIIIDYHQVLQNYLMPMQV